MAAGVGIWLGLSGALAVLVGLTGLRRVRRLRRRGTRAWAQAAPLPGERVLIWYDPADPGDILVSGRPRRLSDVILLVVGMVFVAAGAVTGTLTP